MDDWWDKQIRRADELINDSNHLLTFYAQLLRGQKAIYAHLHSYDELVVQPLLDTVQTHGPESLAAEAKHLSESQPEVLTNLLQEYWNSRSDLLFFGKAALQPYLKYLVERGNRPAIPESERRCPFCGGPPQVSFLSGENSNRSLLCASCLNSWEFRRLVCANCGEERPTQLAYYHSPEFDHINIEACESCKHYLKRIDLTRNGRAAPLVDEIHAAPMDLWAHEHGYTKIEMNLVGI